MTTATDDSRLGILEGRIIEQSGIIGQLRDRVESGLREVNERIDAGMREVNERIDAGLREVRQELRDTNARIDRLFLAILGIGAAQIALLITLIIRTT